MIEAAKVETDNDSALGERVQHLVKQLREAGMSASDIAEALGFRVSRRTVYRWGRGECTPQQSSDLEALEGLVLRLPTRKDKEG